MIKKLLLLILLNMGLANEFGMSASTRTSNDDTQPLDYEYSIKIEDNEGRFKYLLKKDWERELGEKYEDDILKFQHEVIGHIYYGVDYVDKESKDIKYVTYNIGADIGYFKAGVSFKEVEEGRFDPLLNLAFEKSEKIIDLDDNPDIDYKISLSSKTNIYDINIINIKSEVKKWLSKRVNIYAIYNHEYYNTKQDFQFKVGLGVKL